MSNGRILCIGDVALDVLVQLDGTGLEQLRYGSDTPSHVSTHGGGTGGNVASWLKEVGADPLLLARIGRDSVGAALLREIRSLGIEIHEIVVEEVATGTVVVLVDKSGERTMLPDSGANAGLSVADLPPLDGIEGAYISGYSLFNPLSHQGVHEIFTRLRTHQIETFLDPASVGTMLKFAPREKVLRSLPLSDVMILNQSEAEFLSGETDLESMLENLLPFSSLVVIKRGDQGAIARGRDFQSSVADLQEPRKAVDTTGAGDSFAAGFIASWVKERNVKGALIAGNLTAGRCVESLGARPRSA